MALNLRSSLSELMDLISEVKGLPMDLMVQSKDTEEMVLREINDCKKSIGKVRDLFLFEENDCIILPTPPADESNAADDEPCQSSSGSREILVSQPHSDGRIYIDLTCDNEEMPEQDEEEETEEDQPQDPIYTDVLKRNFSYPKFRPMQWKIIRSILEDKKDNFAIMSTGYGKSLMFQFPSVFTKRCSVIVSPLISLMDDQVSALKASSIEACVLGHSHGDTARVIEEMFAGKYRLIYITPESVVNFIDDFKRLDSVVGIDLFAIDEAHLVFQWGNEFRSSYRRLGELKDNFPEIPIIATTATVTRGAEMDIITNLKLCAPKITRTSFDRPNLHLSVIKKSKDPVVSLRRLMTFNGYVYSFSGPTIIYCLKKKDTEMLKNVLAETFRVPCSVYHAGLSPEIRRKCHMDFLNDKVQVVVATVAFGMGIDKPDIRQVIHYGAPQEIESYYQEIGRAGRDGLSSTCTVMYQEADFATVQYFIRKTEDPVVRHHKFEMYIKMRKYLTTEDCRRRVLLQHFEPDDVSGYGGLEGCCDCCNRRSESGMQEPSSAQQDYSEDAKVFLNVVQMTGNIYGLGSIVLVLKGSSDKRVTKFNGLSYHGSGNYKTKGFWKRLGYCLLNAGYLKEELIDGIGQKIVMTEKAWSWMTSRAKDDNVKIEITPNVDLEEEAVRVIRRRSALLAPLLHSPLPDNKTQIPSLEADLFVHLLEVRDRISNEIGSFSFAIASSKMLRDLAKIRPSCLSKLMNVEDFSEVKVKKFGNKFVDFIVSFSKDKSLDLDQFPEETCPLEYKQDEEFKAKMSKLSGTQQESYYCFMICKDTLECVAARRGIKTSNVVTHLCQAILVGLPVDKTRLGLTKEMEGFITRTIRANPINGEVSRIRDIQWRLPPSVERNHIFLMRAELIYEYGTETNAKGKLVLKRPAV